MTIGELINKLADFPSDMEVVINGYEGGYEPIGVESLMLKKIRVNKHHIDRFKNPNIVGKEPATMLLIARSSEHDDWRIRDKINPSNPDYFGIHGDFER